MTPRKMLGAAILAALPDAGKGWALVDTQRAIDRPSQPTVQLSLSTIKPADSAPRSHFDTAWTVTLIDPHEDIEKAENALDELVPELFDALDAVPWLWVEDATKVQYSQAGLVAYDLTVHTLIDRKV